MSAVPKRRFSLAEYLAKEDAAEFKSEFFAGEMFAVAGAAPEHNGIKENLSIEVGGRLRGGPCRTYSGDQRVAIDETGLFTYPDFVVVCGRPEFHAADRNSLTNPLVVVEVLSDSTEGYDRGAKFRNYQARPSIREYWLVSQDRMLVERYVRQPDGDWRLTVFDDPAGDVEFASIPVRLPLASLYLGVEFPDEPMR